MGQERKVYKVLVGKPEGDYLEDQGKKWEDGIRMDLRETGWGSVEWIHLSQDMGRWRALVNTVTNLRVMEPQS
jgi:hypothetical protein